MYTSCSTNKLDRLCSDILVIRKVFDESKKIFLTGQNLLQFLQEFTQIAH